MDILAFDALRKSGLPYVATYPHFTPYLEITSGHNKHKQSREVNGLPGSQELRKFREFDIARLRGQCYHFAPHREIASYHDDEQPKVVNGLQSPPEYGKFCDANIARLGGQSMTYTEPASSSQALENDALISRYNALTWDPIEFWFENLHESADNETNPTATDLIDDEEPVSLSPWLNGQGSESVKREDAQGEENSKGSAGVDNNGRITEVVVNEDAPSTPSGPRTAPEICLPPTPELTPEKNLKRTAATALDAAQQDADYKPRKRFKIPPKLTIPPPPQRNVSLPPSTSPYGPAPGSSPVPSTAFNMQFCPTPGFWPTDLEAGKKPFVLAACELERVWEAVEQQVDWQRVAEHVASNRAAGTFRAAIERIVRAKVDELEYAE